MVVTFQLKVLTRYLDFMPRSFEKIRQTILKNGFQTKDAISREDALRAMTIWAAYVEFSENDKGSLEVGKFADFVIMDADLMTVPEETLFDLKVSQTWIGGEQVYEYH